MEKKKRISLIKSEVPKPIAVQESNTNKIKESPGGIRSVGVQTDLIKLNSLESVVQPRKFARPKTVYIQQQKWPAINPETVVEDDKLSSRNKACQTIKTGLKRVMSNMQMDKLKDVMAKRRKLSIIQDRARLQHLMAVINADPPPPWAEASLMWLEVDKLENRIEEYEKEEKEDEKNEEATTNKEDEENKLVQ